MTSENKKYYYAVVSKTNGKMLLIDAQIPIFWRLDAARITALKFPNSYVTKVTAKQLNELIY